MKVRVTKIGRSLSDTHSQALNAAAVPSEVVEGTLVLYRPPSVDGKPRHSATTLGIEEAVKLGSSRLCVLHIGSDGAQHQWASGPARMPPTVCKEGWKLMTNRSTYLVEVLQEGLTPRRARRDTGSFPIYDPTPTGEK